jgi:hypothetical protein
MDHLMSQSQQRGSIASLGVDRDLELTWAVVVILPHSRILKISTKAHLHCDVVTKPLAHKSLSKEAQGSLNLVSLEL